jgi:primosomal protein N' (replication factor Y)
MQVAGRAGRGDRPGTVLIQTRYPGHPLFMALARHDYAAFAAQQLTERRDAALPPFVAQALLTAESRDMPKAIAWLDHAREAGERIAGELGVAIRLFDPVPMPLARLADVDRAQLLAEADQRPALQAFLVRWLTALREAARGGAGGAALATTAGKAPPAGGVRWQIDVDPQQI